MATIIQLGERYERPPLYLSGVFAINAKHQDPIGTKVESPIG